MGQKDLSEKILADYNDVFADIINVLVFKGEERIKPNELGNVAVHSQYKADDSKLHEEERDVSKYWKKAGITFAIIGLENQTDVDKNMPFRIIGYDGASYRSQLLAKPKKVVPVVTFVLYFGTEKRWNKNYEPDDKRVMKHVDEVLKLLSVMSGDRKYESLLYDKKRKVKTMCEVAERLVNKGIAKGTEIGRTEGLIEGQAM